MAHQLHKAVGFEYIRLMLFASGATIGFCLHDFFAQQIVVVGKVKRIHLVFAFTHFAASVKAHYFNGSLP